MSEELENKAENTSAEQGNQENDTNREAYRSRGYSSYRPQGRSPRPRIQQRRPYTPRGENSGDDGGFRPEGFGQNLQQDAPQYRSYQPRYNNDNRQRGGYGGFQQRYGNDEGYDSQRGYRPRQGGYQQGGYRQRYSNNDEGGYQPRPQRGGYRPRYNGDDGDNGGYQQRGGYNRQGGYQPRGYRQGGYQPRGGYNRQGGYGYGNRGNYRPHSADYDPNAKYSMKKRIEYSEAHIDPNAPIRLNKYLANAGICSRREADQFIQAGVVSVNGNVVTELGTKVLRSDVVKFHDETVNLEKKVYVLLNKPKDCVTTSDDPQQRKTVMQLVKDACPERIYPVGRLDRNTTGVLLLTNDGDLASKLTHPKFLKKKVYHVTLDKNVTAHDLHQITEGITLDDGEVHADAAEYAHPTDKSQVGIEIHSGKNRIVRRIFESLGYRVVKLDRVLFAGLTKKNLRRGDWRFLTEKEVEMLRMGAFE